MKKHHIILSLSMILNTNTCISQSIKVSLSKTLSQHTEPINCLAYSPDGKTLASGSAAENILSDEGKFEIIIWDISSASVVTHLTGHKSPIESVAFDKSGNFLVSSDSNGEIIVWSLERYAAINAINADAWIGTVCFTQDAKYILGEYSYGKIVNIWDSETGELLSTLPINLQIGSMDISPDGSKIALSCYHEVQVWSLIGKKKLVSIADTNVNGFGIKYSNDGKKLAVGLGNGDIKIFEPETLTLLQIFQGHFKPVLSVSFSKDNDYLVSGSSDQMIKLWNLESQKELQSLVNEHRGTVQAVSFNPTSNSFATAGQDKMIKIWKMR